MGRTVLFSFLILCLVAVSVRLAEAQGDNECPSGVNMLKLCRCQAGGFGICWNQKCDLCDLEFRKKRSVSFRHRRPRPGNRRCNCPSPCDCSLNGAACCCPWSSNPECRK